MLLNIKLDADGRRDVTARLRQQQLRLLQSHRDCPPVNKAVKRCFSLRSPQPRSRRPRTPAVHEPPFNERRADRSRPLKLTTASLFVIAASSRPKPRYGPANGCPETASAPRAPVCPCRQDHLNGEYHSRCLQRSVQTTFCVRTVAS